MSHYRPRHQPPTTAHPDRSRRGHRTRRWTTPLAALAVFTAVLVAPVNGGARPLAAATRGQSYAAIMLRVLNHERAVHHRRPLAMNARLIRSAHWHDLAMARANSLDHQVRGEYVFTRRISRAGYHWAWAAENIGWNSQTTVHGLIAMQQLMYAERAPNDGHRVNILSSRYAEVGIDVYFDAAHHKMWFTQDFGRRA